MNETKAYEVAAAQWGISGLTEIFRGGQKTVARGTIGDQEVALKLVHLDSSGGAVDLRRCQREVSLLRSISSPNVVAVLTDLLVLGDPPEAAMWLETYLDGEDLSNHLGHNWEWSETRHLITGVARGLAELHTKGCVHRDLSPRNIRKASSGWVVMDPGLAKHLGRSSITGPFDPGTPGYMSPEHLSPDIQLTPAADIFSLGILAYLALTTKLPIPFDGNWLDYRRRLVGSGAPKIGVSRPDMTLSDQAIVDRCLLRQPARRYLNAGELLTAMGDLGRS